MRYPLKYPFSTAVDTPPGALSMFKERLTNSASRLALAIGSGHLKPTGKGIHRFGQTMGNADAALERYLKRAQRIDGLKRAATVQGMKHIAHTVATVQSLKSSPKVPAWVEREDIARPHVRRAAIKDLARFEKDIRMGDSNVRLVLNRPSLDSIRLDEGPIGFHARYMAHVVSPDGLVGPKVARVLIMSPDFAMDFDNTYSVAFGIELGWYDKTIDLERRTEFASGILRNFREAKELGFTEMSYLAGARINGPAIYSSGPPELIGLQPPNGFRLELAARNPDARLWDGPSSYGAYGISENQDAIKSGLVTLAQGGPGPPYGPLTAPELLLVDELGKRIANGELPSLREMAALGAPPGESSSELGTRLLRAIENPRTPSSAPLVMETI